MFTHSQVLFIEYVDPQGRGVVVSRESTNKSLVSRVKSCVLSSHVYNVFINIVISLYCIEEHRNTE